MKEDWTEQHSCQSTPTNTPYTHAVYPPKTKEYESK